MPKQRDYQVRADRKDKDLEALYDVGQKAGKKAIRKVGLWETIKSCLALLLLFFICGLIAAIVTGTSSAQSPSSSDNSCFQHKTLYTILPVEIRSNDSYLARELGKTTRNKTYKVLESKKAALFNSCWIRISNGWLLRRANSSVIRPRTRTSLQQTTSANTTSSRCYTLSKAYITGAMNIRKAASVSSAKVGSAQAGDSFTISQSKRGGDYCWLKISKGWIAKTGRVQSTKPISRTITVTCPIPPIYGSASLKNAVKRAYNVLGKHPAWCTYVTSAGAASFEQLTFGGCARLDSSERQIEVYLSQSLCRSNDAYVTAAFIVHEACHLHQLNAGSRLQDPYQDEPPCYQKQIEFLTSVMPGRYGSIVSQLRGKVKQYSR